MDENPLPILRDGTPLEYRFPLYVNSSLCRYVIPQLIMAMPPSSRVLWMCDPAAAQRILPDTLSWDCVTDGADWFADMRILMSESVMTTYDIIFTAGGISMDTMRLAAESHALVVTPKPHVFYPGLAGGAWVPRSGISTGLPSPTRIDLQTAQFYAEIVYHQKNYYVRKEELNSFAYFQ